MATISLQKYDGGTAEDLRTFATDQCEKSINFDVFDNPHYLQPYRDNVAEVVTGQTITDFEMNGTVIATIGVTDYYIALGKENSGSSKPGFFYKTVTDVTQNFLVGGVGTGVVLKGSLIVYKSSAYCLAVSGSDTLLEKLTATATVVTSGTTSGMNTPVKPFIHPEDNIMYIVSGSTISKWDGTTFTSYSSILPIDFIPASLTNYGTYLVIAGNLANKAIAYLWGRDGTINTLQGVIDFGNGNILCAENINEVLYAVTTPSKYLETKYRIEVQNWAGGQTNTIKSINSDYSLASFVNGIHKAKKGDTLYFALPEEAIYKLSVNKSGAVTLSKDRLIYTGGITTVINGFSFIGDYMWIGFNISGQNGYFYRTENTASFLRTSIYKTTINPSMPIEDRYKNKQLVGVQIAYTGASLGLTVLKYSVDGSAMTTIISDTNTTGEKVTEATSENSGAVFLNGREFQFQLESTGGAKIKEIKYKYEILNTTV